MGSLLVSLGSFFAQDFVVPSKSLFPQSCVSPGSSMVGLVVTSSKRAYAIPRSAAPRAPVPAAPLLICASSADSQTLKGRSGSVSVGSPGIHKILFEPSKHLWQVWGLILNVILPSNYLAGVSPLPLDVGYSLPPKMEKLYTMSKNKIGS